MTNLHSQSLWAPVKKLVLALPLLALSAVAVPHAHADDHYGRLHHEIREDERHGDYGQARRDRRELHYREGYHYDRGYYHGGRYYRGRRSRYYHGRRVYTYFGVVPGVSVNVGL